MASKAKRKTVRTKTPKKRLSAMSASPPAAGTTTAGAAGSVDSRVTVRHYCQGIGDCHLLKFPKQGGGDFFMLIDCGVHSSVPDGAKTISNYEQGQRAFRANFERHSGYTRCRAEAHCKEDRDRGSNEVHSDAEYYIPRSVSSLWADAPHRYRSV